MTKKQTIQHYMDKLGLSYDEAEQLWLDEQEDNLPKLSKEQKAVEREMMRGDRKKETQPRNRERKVDVDKRYLISLLAHALTSPDDESPDVKITHPERQIDFVFNGEHFRLVLSKPRKISNGN